MAKVTSAFPHQTGCDKTNSFLFHYMQTRQRIWSEEKLLLCSFNNVHPRHEPCVSQDITKYTSHKVHQVHKDNTQYYSRNERVTLAFNIFGLTRRMLVNEEFELVIQVTHGQIHIPRANTCIRRFKQTHGRFEGLSYVLVCLLTFR